MHLELLTSVGNLEDEDVGAAHNKACLGTAQPSYAGSLSFSLSNI